VLLWLTKTLTKEEMLIKDIILEINNFIGRKTLGEKNY